jgi:hypothetical protein
VGGARRERVGVTCPFEEWAAPVRGRFGCTPADEEPISSLAGVAGVERPHEHGFRLGVLALGRDRCGREVVVGSGGRAGVLVD